MNRKHSSVLLLLLSASIICNAVLGMAAIRVYQKYNHVRTDPLGLLNETDTQEEGNYDYFLIGDSLIANWDIAGASVANEGIGAQTSGQVMYRMRLLGDALHAKKSIICVGGNDLKILRFDTELSADVIRTSLSNIREIIRLSKGISDQTYIVTIPPMYTVPFYMEPLKSTQVMLSALEELNQGILDVAADEGVEVIDCETVLQGMSTEDVLAPDNVHLSEKAYEALFSELQDD